MNITQNTLLIGALASLLLAPCIVEAAAESDGLQAPNTVRKLVLKHKDRTEQRLQELIDAQEDSKEDEDALNPRDLSDDEKEKTTLAERPKYTRRKALAQLALESGIGYASRRLQEAIQEGIRPENIDVIRAKIDAIGATPFRNFSRTAQQANRITLHTIHHELFELNNFIDEQLAAPTMIRLTADTIENATQAIDDAQNIEYFPQENIQNMQREVETQLSTSFETIHDFQRAIKATNEAIQEQFNAGKEAAAKKATHIDTKIREEVSQFAAKTTGMGPLFL